MTHGDVAVIAAEENLGPLRDNVPVEVDARVELRDGTVALIGANEDKQDATPTSSPAATEAIKNSSPAGWQDCCFW